MAWHLENLESQALINSSWLNQCLICGNLIKEGSQTDVAWKDMNGWWRENEKLDRKYIIFFSFELLQEEENVPFYIEPHFPE